MLAVIYLAFSIPLVYQNVTILHNFYQHQPMQIRQENVVQPVSLELGVGDMTTSQTLSPTLYSELHVRNTVTSLTQPWVSPPFEPGCFWCRQRAARPEWAPGKCWRRAHRLAGGGSCRRWSVPTASRKWESKENNGMEDQGSNWRM